jgi:hypothetical protein
MRFNIVGNKLTESNYELLEIWMHVLNINTELSTTHLVLPDLAFWEIII